MPIATLTTYRSLYATFRSTTGIRARAITALAALLEAHRLPNAGYRSVYYQLGELEAATARYDRLALRQPLVTEDLRYVRAAIAEAGDDYAAWRLWPATPVSPRARPWAYRVMGRGAASAAALEAAAEAVLQNLVYVEGIFGRAVNRERLGY